MSETPQNVNISSEYGGAQANETKRTTGPESLASSARGSPVVDSSTMIYTSQQFRLNGVVQFTESAAADGGVAK